MKAATNNNRDLFLWKLNAVWSMSSGNILHKKRRKIQEFTPIYILDTFLLSFIFMLLTHWSRFNSADFGGDNLNYLMLSSLAPPNPSSYLKKIPQACCHKHSLKLTQIIIGPITKAEEMINGMIFVSESCDPNSLCRKVFIETRKRHR